MQIFSCAIEDLMSDGTVNEIDFNGVACDTCFCSASAMPSLPCILQMSLDAANIHLINESIHSIL